MCALSQDGVWETDSSHDFSSEHRRMDSFRGSSLAQQVPADRLARAGFFYTGQSDRVRCFSCNTIVENWCRGDKPVDRHKEVSPSCTFLSCVHRTSFNLNSNTPLINGSVYSEEAEDMQYRLRTGEVVDQTVYPKVPHMRREEARLQTFSCWPTSAPVKPSDLAQAGLFYVGQNDEVQCFCCGIKLSGWETGDTAWGEHERHFSSCFFILGQDVGNIPIQGGLEVDSSSSQHANAHVSMKSFEKRRDSFAGVQHPVDHERLARAGFYSTGRGDEVLCFRCGGGLKDWMPEEDPWEEHARHYPGCSFLLAEKGPEFVNSIQLQGPQYNKAASSHQTAISEDGKDEDPMEKLQRLQREKQCKICMDRDIGMVFVPCGHLVACEECSWVLDKCPICCGPIEQKFKTYIA